MENGFPYGTHWQQITRLAKGQEAKRDLANILNSIQTPTHWRVAGGFRKRNRVAEASIRIWAHHTHLRASTGKELEPGQESSVTVLTWASPELTSWEMIPIPSDLSGNNRMFAQIWLKYCHYRTIMNLKKLHSAWSFGDHSPLPHTVAIKYFWDLI